MRNSWNLFAVKHKCYMDSWTKLVFCVNRPFELAGQICCKTCWIETVLWKFPHILVLQIQGVYISLADNQTAMILLYLLQTEHYIVIKYHYKYYINVCILIIEHNTMLYMCYMNQPVGSKNKYSKAYSISVNATKTSI